VIMSRGAVFLFLIATTIIGLLYSVSAEPESTALNEATQHSEILSFDHVGLVVRDLEASKTFFTNVLGFNLVGSDNEYPAHFLNNGKAFVTLWRASDPQSAVHFDRKNNIGLHHMALAVASEAALNRLYKTAAAFPDVVVEFAPELFYGGPSMHTMIYEPSGNRIELIYRAR